MALADLASSADLQARGVDVTDTALVAAKLAEASAAIREAAGVPISQVTSTVELVVTRWSQWLDLPGQPVTAVSAVAVDSVAVTDYRLLAGRLYRSGGWGGPCAPVVVSVTMTHGYAEVPADIVGLVCDFTIAGMATAAEGTRAGLVSSTESIDDYSVTEQYASGDDASASVMEVPERTRQMLRARFGGGVFVTREGE